MKHTRKINGMTERIAYNVIIMWNMRIRYKYISTRLVTFYRHNG